MMSWKGFDWSQVWVCTYTIQRRKTANHLSFFQKRGEEYGRAWHTHSLGLSPLPFREEKTPEGKLLSIQIAGRPCIYMTVTFTCHSKSILFFICRFWLLTDPILSALLSRKGRHIPPSLLASYSDPTAFLSSWISHRHLHFRGCKQIKQTTNS